MHVISFMISLYLSFTTSFHSLIVTSLHFSMAYSYSSSMASLHLAFISSLYSLSLYLPYSSLMTFILFSHYPTAPSNRIHPPDISPHPSSTSFYLPIRLNTIKSLLSLHISIHLLCLSYSFYPPIHSGDVRRFRVLRPQTIA